MHHDIMLFWLNLTFLPDLLSLSDTEASLLGEPIQQTDDQKIAKDCILLNKVDSDVSMAYVGRDTVNIWNETGHDNRYLSPT